MGRFEYGPASAACRAVPGSRAGLVRVSYFGMLNDASMAVLVSKMASVARDAPVCVSHMERAVLTLERMPAIEEAVKTVVDAAIIVAPADRDLFVEYARRLSEVGVNRAVFLESQVEQAYRWAERRAKRVLGL